MKAKKMISVLAGIAFFAAFAVCPAFAGSEDLSGSYAAVPPKEHNLITGTLDYLGSVVEVTADGAMSIFSSALEVPSAVTGEPPRRCVERVTYRPSIVMNRGSRWRRVYHR